MNHFNQAGDLDSGAAAGNEGTGRELFALTDEQILEIEPEAQSDTGDEEKATSLPLTASAPAPGSATQRAAGQPATTGTATGKAAGAGAAAGVEPPRWLAEMMSDPQSGGEARDFWQGVTQAREDAAAYREVFAKPAEARAAAQRARTLDEIDRAYFTGDASDRSQLAATMMREDPAAFREMVFEGLRALQEAEKGRGAGNGTGDSRMARAFAGASGAAQGTTGARAGATNTTSALNAGSNSGLNSGPAPAETAAQHGNAERAARMAAYASFEKSANEDLERNVGGAIARTLEQALPNTGRGDSDALKSRLVGTIRHDVEKALQGDRQLGEQVAQLLSGKQLNNETRAQVVRLIGERAEQLVPGATKRALKDWTQSTLAAHRERTGRGAAVGARQEVTPAATSAGGRGDSQNKPARDAAAASARGAAGRGVDYRKFSDEQILAM
jgi:hypothetical protein